ncbi:hypothetical protein SB6411_02569 [Klebsiella spallanzanii]|uniref:Lipoprotein n=2 Tax=Klebsiella spallanzanii TaxID=2587528 RepID=A0ABY6VGU8_9ENTR|nr:hypothetical protein SB6411_02569 [Klebsiella spallanzanii]
MKKTVFLACVLPAILLTGCVAKPPIATESEMKNAASFALNVDISQVTISDVQQNGVKTNFVATTGKKSHRCYVTKAAEAKLYGLIPLDGGETVSDAICSGGNAGSNGKTCDALSKKAGRC